MEFQEDMVDQSDDIEIEGEEPEAPEEEVEVEAEGGEVEAPAEPESEPEAPKKQKVPLSTRFNQVQKEKFQALERERQVAAENERLRKRLAESETALSHHYGDKVNMSLEQAKKRQLEAVESGDAQAMIDAQAEVAKATYASEELKREESNRKYQAETRQQEQQQQQAAYYTPDETAAQQWAAANTWFDADSDDFDQELAAYADSKAAEINQQLQSSGQGHLIGSPAYFHEINKHVRQADEYRRQAAPVQRKEHLVMKRTNTPVASVRGSGGNAYSARGGSARKMTAAEARMASKFGVSNKEYMEKALQQERDGLHLRGTR
jgi:hypothetical protein